MAHVHIGHLGEYYCQVVIDESRKLLQERLEQAEAGATGVTAKGFQAIRMLMDTPTERSGSGSVCRQTM